MEKEDLINVTKQLFIKYKSDKYHHGYHEIYDFFLNKLKNKKLTILEIGVSDGDQSKVSNFLKNL